MMDYIWLIIIACTHAAVYCFGKRDGLAEKPDEDAWIEVRKYELDKHYEHQRWLEERKDTHDA